MALFNNNDNQSNENSNNTTIITAGTHFKGELNLSCNLFIDGEFDGKIVSSQEVSVGAKGKVRGEITTKHLVVQGDIEADVQADRLEIKEGGHLKGLVVSTEFVIEPKGIFEGESRIKSNGVAVPPPPKAAEKKA